MKKTLIKQTRPAAACLFFAAGLYALVQFYIWSFSVPYLQDYDGFYYLQEFTRRVASGEGYYHGFSVFFSFLTLIYAPLSPVFPDPALFLLWFTFAVYLLFVVTLSGVAYSPKNLLFSGLFFYVVASSEVVFYLFYGFQKQGLSLLLFAVGVLLLKHCRSLWRWGSAPFFVSGAMMHPFVMLITPVYLLSVVPYPQKNGYKRAGMLLWCAAAAVLAVTLKPDLPQNLTFFSVPFAGESAWQLNFITLRARAEFLLYFLATLFLFFSFFYQKNRQMALWLFFAVFFLLSLPLWEVPGGFWYRFIRTGVVVFFFILALYPQQSQKTLYDPKTLAALVIAGALLCLSFPAKERHHPVGPAFPTETLARHAPELKELLPGNSFVLAPHGVQFQVTYFLDLPSAKSYPVNTRYDHYFELRQVGHLMSRCEKITAITGKDVADGICINISEGWVLHEVEQPEDSSGF